METEYQDVEKRIENATQLLDEILQIAENNRHLFYSGGVASRLPRSFGANAFNVLQHSNFKYLIIRLVALWDHQQDTNGVFRIDDLIDDAIIEQACSVAISEYQNTTSSYAEQNAKTTRERIDLARKKINSTRDSHQLAALKKIRSEKLAHTGIEKREKASTSPLKLGDEEWLIQRSIEVLELLYSAINRRSYSFEESRKIYEKNAKQLWTNIDFSAVQ